MLLVIISNRFTKMTWFLTYWYFLQAVTYMIILRLQMEVSPRKGKLVLWLKQTLIPSQDGKSLMHV
uniref:Uncharacterized protein n=1 Tax=Cucumis melo TaxID=3656 RepID=A0A9I9E4I5_CUCME